MLIEPFYREDAVALREDLEVLEQTLQSARKGGSKELMESKSELRDLLTGFDSQMVKECRRARRILDDVETHINSDGLSSFGLLLAATGQSLQGEAQSLEAALVAMESQSPREMDLGSVNRLLNWVRGKILPVVSRILGTIWKILINVLSPRSWKVKGGIGSTFPGLTEGELVIDFERSG